MGFSGSIWYGSFATATTEGQKWKSERYTFTETPPAGSEAGTTILKLSGLYANLGVNFGIFPLLGKTVPLTRKPT